jgi:phosphoglycerol transferase MdoB-like AlkP superfamily enzyme
MSEPSFSVSRTPARGDLRFWGAAFSVGMVLLSVQRLLLFLLHAPDAEHGGTFADALPAFVHGLRFDAAALGYPFAAAVLAGSLWHTLHRPECGRRADQVAAVAALGLVTVLAVVEVFFFEEFRTRLNFVAIEYLDDPLSTLPLAFEFAGVGGSVAAVAALLALVAGSAWAVHRLERWATGAPGVRPSYAIRGVLLALLVIAARGGLGRPIRPQDAHPSGHRFVNQLALSGPFTLGRHVYETWKDRGGRPDYGTDPAEELATARTVFAHPEDAFRDDAYPALRPTRVTGPPRRLNVVFVVLESFASRLVGVLGATPEEACTPELDALSREGVFFPRFLATGPSTNRSLPALVAGIPCLVKRTSIPKSTMGQRELITIATVLRDEGYQTAFLRSGGPSWENLGGWLRSHGFENLINRNELDRTQAVSSAGPPDHVLFERVLAECDTMAERGPFLAAMLTTTNHPPFALPDPLPEGVRARIEAVPEGPDAPRRRGVLYADWAFADFVRTARTRDWGRDTIFVVVGDHGIHVAPVADIDPDRRHVPFLLLGPVPELEPRREERLGSHVDVLPTLLGLLRIRTDHAAWGRDLLTDDPTPRHAVLGPHGGLRAYAIAAEDGSYLVDYLDGRHELYDLDLAGRTLTPRPDDDTTVTRLRRLGRAYLSTAHRALEEGRAGPRPEASGD